MIGIDIGKAEFHLMVLMAARVNLRHSEHLPGTSAVEGKADVAWQGLSGPFLASSGHCRDAKWKLPVVSVDCRTAPILIEASTC
jgi:hypothetical protein